MKEAIHRFQTWLNQILLAVVVAYPAYVNRDSGTFKSIIGFVFEPLKGLLSVLKDLF